MTAFKVGDRVVNIHDPGGEFSGVRKVVATGPQGKAIRLLNSDGRTRTGWLHAHNYVLAAKALDAQPMVDIALRIEAAEAAKVEAAALRAEHDADHLVSADILAALADPLCSWILDELGEECGADRSLFAVVDAAFSTEMGHAAIYGDPSTVVCAAHLPAAITTRDDLGKLAGVHECSIVLPITEHPLRGRPPEAVRKAASANGSASLDMVGA